LITCWFLLQTVSVIEQKGTTEKKINGLQCVHACLNFLFIPQMDVNHASCAADGLIALRDKRKGSPCQQDGDSQGAADIEIPSLPEVHHK
jgi:hypothetical protein